MNFSWLHVKCKILQVPSTSYWIEKLPALVDEDRTDWITLGIFVVTNGQTKESKCFREANIIWNHV